MSHNRGHVNARIPSAPKSRRRRRRRKRKSRRGGPGERIGSVDGGLGLVGGDPAHCFFFLKEGG